MNLEHISEKLMRDFDTAVGEAIRQVDDHQTEQASVSLAVTVGRDKDGEMIAEFVQKDGSKRAGSWRPSLHPRLPFSGDDLVPDGVDSVTLASGGREVTLKRRGA